MDRNVIAAALQLLGLVAVIVGGWLVSVPAGMIATGAAVFVFGLAIEGGR